MKIEVERELICKILLILLRKVSLFYEHGVHNKAKQVFENVLTVIKTCDGRTFS